MSSLSGDADCIAFGAVWFFCGASYMGIPGVVAVGASEGYGSVFEAVL